MLNNLDFSYCWLQATSLERRSLFWRFINHYFRQNGDISGFDG
ncbi:hypothetical protein [Merismopedia glauca]|nr:hypothetical protein [Merismopedia glauca]